MKEMKTVVFGILMIVCLATSTFAQSAAELYQQGLVQENGAGNLRNAIQLYERAAKEAKADRTTAALALMGAARCYEKLGQVESRRLYEQVANSYSDQAEQAAMARERLGGNIGEVNMGLIQTFAREATLGFMKSHLDTLTRQAAELAERYTAQHPARVKLAVEIGNYSRAMRTASQQREREIIGEGAFKKRWTNADIEGQFTGIVKAVQLTNPSITVVVEVRQTTGELQTYRIKGMPPKAFLSAGYVSTIKEGDTVTVEGLFQGDDPMSVNLATLTLGDGTKIFLGSSVSGLRD
jgi:hypothetical protein